MKIKIHSIKKYLANQSGIAMPSTPNNSETDNVTELSFTVLDENFTFINSNFSITIKNSPVDFELGTIYNLVEEV